MIIWYSWNRNLIKVSTLEHKLCERKHIICRISKGVPTMIKLTTTATPLEYVLNTTTSQRPTLRPQSKLPGSVTGSIARPPNWSPDSTLNLHSVVHRASRGIFFKCKSHHTSLLKTAMAFLTTLGTFQSHYQGLKTICHQTGVPLWSPFASTSRSPNKAFHEYLKNMWHNGVRRRWRSMRLMIVREGYRGGSER